jgi:hypothetical protein
MSGSVLYGPITEVERARDLFEKHLLKRNVFLLDCDDKWGMGKERNLLEMLGFFRDMLVSADEVEVLNPTRQQWSAFSLNVQVLLILKLEDRLDSTYMAIPLNIFFSSYCSYTHVLKMWRCGECKNKDKEMEACKGRRREHELVETDSDQTGAKRRCDESGLRPDCHMVQSSATLGDF